MLLLCSSASNADASLIVDLDPGAAQVAYSSGGTGEYTGLGANLALGHTVHATLTPAAGDLSGTVLIMEYGGTANGFNLGLVDGILTYMAKHNSSDAFAPDSLNDTALRPNGTTRGEAAVQSTAGPLAAGTEYSVAVSWDQAGNLQLGVSDGSEVERDSITLTGVFGNWAGNNSLGVGHGYSSFGGYSGELAGSVLPNPFDVNDTPVNSFTGSIGQLLYWNAAGNIVPEPHSIAMLLAGLSLCAAMRHRCAR